MTFLGLFRREVDERELVDKARSFLDGIRLGRSEREAAERAEVSAEELRGWKRDGAFRAAIKRAKRDGPGLTAQGICSFEQLDQLAPWDPYAPPPPGGSELEIERAGWRRR